MDPVSIAAVGWGVSALGWLASPIITKLLTKGFDYLGYDTTKKLARLEPKILVLQRVMEVVQESAYRPRLQQLFKQLKSAFYEAEEILDDVEYHCLERQIQDSKLQSDSGARQHKRDRLKKKLSSSMVKLSLLTNKESGMSKTKLIKSLKKIEDVINESHQILDKLNLSSISNGNIRQTMVVNHPTTAVSLQKVFGRDDDREKIIAMLHEKDGDIHLSTSNGLCFSVIGIHGVSGSGKSTLAQFVCASEEKDKQEKKEGHFDLVMWVHVSQNFSVGDIFKEFYEAASEPKDASEPKNACPPFNNPNELRKELERKLEEKKFLLVLDDVWCNQDVGDQNLPELLSPLKVGKRGSKILVTTRSKYALPDLCPGVRYTSMPITEVDDTAFFELFMHYALEEGQDQSMFQNIGAEIARKLMRSPLAAKTVGGILRRQQEVNYWRGVKDQDLFNKWTGPLWWSYYQLGEQARRCFAYCSIFPRRHRLYRDDLVRLWMAEGFIRNTGGGEDIEEVGQEIFNELLSISFIQPGGKDWDLDYRCYEEYYVVHDLLHDLAEAVAGSDCLRIDNSTSQNGRGWAGDIPRDVRHLFVQNYDVALITEKILELGNLHTLIIYSVEWYAPVEEIVIKSILKSLPKLRVLAFAFTFGSEILSIPESISQLKHLRYLAFRMKHGCKEALPSTLNQLYQMQLLDFGDCNNLVFSCCDLIDLRHIFSSSGSQISNVSRLISLRTFPKFTIRSEQGHEARQLRYLNRLRGKLSIDGLENVKSREEALEVNLAAKEQLTHLELRWDDDIWCSPEVEAEVLEGLCPPVGLEKLTICDYKGLVYPYWMVGRKNGGPEKLQILSLMEWRQRGAAPVLVAFIHLRELYLHRCSWNALPGNMEHLTSLETLSISGCMDVRSLPTLPRSLGHFTLEKCDAGFMKSCKIEGHPNWQKIQHIPYKDIWLLAEESNSRL